ncbi:N/A [soil metagenome]
MTTEDRLRDLIARELGIGPDQVQLDAKLREDLHADAIDIIGLSLAIEDEFDIRMTDDEVEAATTVRAYGLLIDQHHAGAAAPAG